MKKIFSSAAVSRNLPHRLSEPFEKAFEAAAKLWEERGRSLKTMLFLPLSKNREVWEEQHDPCKSRVKKMHSVHKQQAQMALS